MFECFSSGFSLGKKKSGQNRIWRVDPTDTIVNGLESG
jgi:hypothetical protein